MGGFLALQIFLKPLGVETNGLRISFEDGFHISFPTPRDLVAIEKRMHFPEFSLQPGRFRGTCGFGRMVVHLEREIAEDHTELRSVFLFELEEIEGHVRTRRTLEIAELFQGDDSLRRPLHVGRLSSWVRGSRGTQGLFEFNALSSEKIRATAQCGSGDEQNDGKGQVTFHSEMSVTNGAHHRLKNHNVTRSGGMGGKLRKALMVALLLLALCSSRRQRRDRLTCNKAA